MSDRLKELTDQLRATLEAERRRPITPVRTGDDLPERRKLMPQFPAGSSDVPTRVQLSAAEDRERMAKLNAAFEKRTAAVKRFQDNVQTLRKSVSQSDEQQYCQTVKDWADRLAEASRERDPEKSTELKAEADVDQLYIEAFRKKREMNIQQQADAKKVMKEELAAIDEEIEALGGRLSVTPRPRLVKSKGDES